MTGKRKREAATATAGDDDAARHLTSAEVEAGMVLALASGDAVLGWAKTPQDPWWPCLAARAIAPLELFDEIDPTDLELPLEPNGDAPRGKVLAYFLGEDTCCVVDNGFFDRGAWAKKPAAKHVEERAEYAAGARLAERLQARVDALEEGAEARALAAAVRAGKATVVEAVTPAPAALATGSQRRERGGKAAGAGEGAPQLLRSSWPAVEFVDWEAATATELGLALPKQALGKDAHLVFYLGAAWGGSSSSSTTTPSERWAIAPSVLPLAAEAGSDSKQQPPKGDGAWRRALTPSMARFLEALHAAALAEARSLFAAAAAGAGGEGGGGAAGAVGSRRVRPTRSVSTNGSATLAPGPAAPAAPAATGGAASSSQGERRLARSRSTDADSSSAVPPSPAASVASTASANGAAKAAPSSRRAAAAAAAAPSSGSKRQRPVAKQEAPDEGPNNTAMAPQQPAAHAGVGAGAPSSMRPLTPEEVEKIRRLAEGLLFVGEVAAFQAQQRAKGGAGAAGATLREDLNALRVFVSRGFPALDMAVLGRLTSGLRAYGARVRAQLEGGQRELERFKQELAQDAAAGAGAAGGSAAAAASGGALLAACEGACGELRKELKRTLGRLEAQRVALEGDVLGKVKKAQGKGSGGALARAVAAEAQGVLAGVRASIAALGQLQEAVGGGGGGGGGGVMVPGGGSVKGEGAACDVASVASGGSLGLSVSVSQSGGGSGGGKKGGHGSRLDPRELLARAEAAFKLGEEVTGDQLAAAEHLRKACEDFMGRLQRKQKQNQQKQQRGKGAAAVSTAGASSSQLPPIPELLPASPVGAAKQAAEEQRRPSLDTQHKLYHAWSPVY